MYPDRELTRLAEHKAALRRDIARRRAQCVVAATRLARPLAWVDRVLTFWRRLSPLARAAAAPLGLLATRIAFPRLKMLRALVRWGPLAWSVVGGIRAAAKNRRARTPAANGRGAEPLRP